MRRRLAHALGGACTRAAGCATPGTLGRAAPRERSVPSLRQRMSHSRTSASVLPAHSRPRPSGVKATEVAVCDGDRRVRGEAEALDAAGPPPAPAPRRRRARVQGEVRRRVRDSQSWKWEVTAVAQAGLWGAEGEAGRASPGDDPGGPPTGARRRLRRLPCPAAASRRAGVGTRHPSSTAKASAAWPEDSRTSHKRTDPSREQVAKIAACGGEGGGRRQAGGECPPLGKETKGEDAAAHRGKRGVRVGP